MAHGAAWFCSGPSHDQVKEYRYVGAEVVDEEGEPFEELYSKLVEENMWTAGSIHVLAGRDSSTAACYIITVYEPYSTIWEDDFKKRRQT